MVLINKQFRMFLSTLPPPPVLFPTHKNIQLLTSSFSFLSRPAAQKNIIIHLNNSNSFPINLIQRFFLQNSSRWNFDIHSGGGRWEVGGWGRRSDPRGGGGLSGWRRQEGIIMLYYWSSSSLPAQLSISSDVLGFMFLLFLPLPPSPPLMTQGHPHPRIQINVLFWPKPR